MNAEAGDKDILLGFLRLCETPDGDGYPGAIMVTDLHGVPQEFRCSHPVKPTAVQRPLYGDTLRSYIGVDLCGVPLVESLKSRTDVIAVNEEFLLGARHAKPYPMVFVRRAGEAIDIAPDGPSTRSARERLESPTGSFQPIVFTAHIDFPEDLPSGRSTFERTFAHFDPIEAFDRIGRAVELLGKQDTRFS